MTQLSINNDKYLQPEDPETQTYEIGYSVSVTFEMVTSIEASSEDHARSLFEEQQKHLAQQAIDQGEKTDLEIDIDYISER